MQDVGFRLIKKEPGRSKCAYQGSHARTGSQGDLVADGRLERVFVLLCPQMDGHWAVDTGFRNIRSKGEKLVFLVSQQTPVC